MNDIPSSVAQALENVRQAALSCGRRPEEITLVAASKMNDAHRVRQAIAAGIRVCGENRVQEMLQKQAQNAYEGAELHFIGHLQKNKVRQVVGLASLIHGVDSIELLQQIDKAAAAKGLVQDVLFQLNIGREASKSGFEAGELPAALSQAAAFGHIRVRGLMAIPPNMPSEAKIKPYFLHMEQLFVDNREKKYDNVSMDFLSMGMSGDYETAIACGANMIRLGSALFGARDYTK